MSAAAPKSRAERKRELARERQRKKRLLESDGIGTVSFRDDIVELADFLRDAGFHPHSAEDEPKALAVAVAKMFRALRDARDNGRERNMLLSEQLACPFCGRNF